MTDAHCGNHTWRHTDSKLYLLVSGPSGFCSRDMFVSSASLDHLPRETFPEHTACCLQETLLVCPTSSPSPQPISPFVFLHCLPHLLGFAKSLLTKRLANRWEESGYSLEGFLRLETSLPYPWDSFPGSYFLRRGGDLAKKGTQNLNLNQTPPSSSRQRNLHMVHLAGLFQADRLATRPSILLCPEAFVVKTAVKKKMTVKGVMEHLWLSVCFLSLLWAWETMLGREPPSRLAPGTGTAVKGRTVGRAKRGARAESVPLDNLCSPPRNHCTWGDPEAPLYSALLIR